MRMVIGVLSLLIVLAVIALLARNQLGPLSGKTAAPAAPDGAAVPTISPSSRAQLMQDQIKKTVDDAMQKSRPELQEQ